LRFRKRSFLPRDVARLHVTAIRNVGPKSPLDAYVVAEAE
jgi:hypothetical protein